MGSNGWFLLSKPFRTRFGFHLRDTAMKLENFKVLTFDCYGTLIEWESGIWNGFSAAAARAEHGHGGIGPSVEVRSSQIRG